MSSHRRHYRRIGFHINRVCVSGWTGYCFSHNLIILGRSADELCRDQPGLAQTMKRKSLHVRRNERLDRIEQLGG